MTSRSSLSGSVPIRTPPDGICSLEKKDAKVTVILVAGSGPTAM
jgi:hypothetical protein